MILFCVFSFIFLLMIVIWIMYPNRQMIKKSGISFAIFTVFIKKENIIFLEEWLDYHWEIGFRTFYLFDNSKVREKTTHNVKNPYLIPGKRNKHGIDYDKCIRLSIEEIDRLWEKIMEKYKGSIIYYDWSPINPKTGRVMHDQVGALNYFNKHMCDSRKIDWIACIDMDEYIFVNTNNMEDYFKDIPYWISNITILQIPFESRFLHPNKYVIEITNSIKNHDLFYHFIDKKYIYRAGTADELQIHFWKGKGMSYIERDRGVMGYMHYNRKRIKNSVKREIFTKEFLETFGEREHWMTRDRKNESIDINYVHSSF